MEQKKCTRCSIVQPSENFRFRPQRNCLDSWCKRCSSMKNIESTYGITIEDYENMRKAQNYCCAICGTHEDTINTRGIKTKNRYRQLVIDHNHHTGKVRGLLCHDCNLILGNAKDDIARLTSAITYLRTTNG